MRYVLMRNVIVGRVIPLVPPTSDVCTFRMGLRRDNDGRHFDGHKIWNRVFHQKNLMLVSAPNLPSLLELGIE